MVAKGNMFISESISAILTKEEVNEFHPSLLHIT